MHTYASATVEARELVEELEFVWNQVKDNTNSVRPQVTPSRGQQQREAHTSHDPPDYDGNHDPPLRVLRPMSDQEQSEAAFEEPGDAPQNPRSRLLASLLAAHSPSRSRSRPRLGQDDRGTWEHRVERSLMQMTAEVAALREVVDSNGGIW